MDDNNINWKEKFNKMFEPETNEYFGIGMLRIQRSITEQQFQLTKMKYEIDEIKKDLIDTKEKILSIQNYLKTNFMLENPQFVRDMRDIGWSL